MNARVVVSRDGVLEREVRLERDIFVVGRHPDCDIPLADPAISLRHMLFRVVGQTVYAEDLESTNGVRVNDVPTKRQVVHHLDVIRIGDHTLHFFDESMLGTFGSLDDTVHTDYEKTLYLRDSERPKWEPPARASAGDDADVALAEPHAAMREHLPEAPHCALRRITGLLHGELVRLDLPNTMVGEDDESALVVRRRDALFITKVSRRRPLRINDLEMGAGSHRIDPGDVVEIGSQRFVVVSLDG